MKDESELLKRWTLDASVPADFNAIVWRRIEARRPINIAAALRQWINELFAKPAVAVAYLSLALLVGLGTAQMQSAKVLRERDSQLQARYVRSIDPYAFPMTR